MRTNVMGWNIQWNIFVHNFGLLFVINIILPVTGYCVVIKYLNKLKYSYSTIIVYDAQVLLEFDLYSSVFWTA
jgi:hypothetical protein